MLGCINLDHIPASWGMEDIQVSETQISFSVYGFNYFGKIVVSVTDTNIELSSSAGHIATTSEPMHAIRILDGYIEANEEKYLNLLKRLVYRNL